MVSSGQAVVLGLVQGLTEFLPVSSSGHLVLGQKLMGLTEPELMFDVAVHVGTLAAVAAVFWRDLWEMARGLWARDDDARRGRRLLWLVIVGSIPAALIGFTLKDFFESLFASLGAVGLALIITGILLMATRLAPRGRRREMQTGAGRALVIGVAQAAAITPGISRSGSTIAAGLYLGLDREMAARFSFVLSVPAILGALLLQVLHLKTGVMADATPLVLGGLTAALSGYLALRLLLGVVRQGRLHWFAYYCWALGAAALVVSLVG